MAIKKPASVLPDPVGAAISTSAPSRTRGQPRAWASVGPSGNRRAHQVPTAGGRPRGGGPGGGGPGGGGPGGGGPGGGGPGGGGPGGGGPGGIPTIQQRPWDIHRWPAGGGCKLEVSEPAGWSRPGNATWSRKVGTPQGRVLANGQSG